MARSARQPSGTRKRGHVKAREAGSASREAHKPTQRERLVDAMIELSARTGYQGVSVARVSARAGVSSATFYECFEDKEDCLLAAYRTAAERVFSQVRPIVAQEGDWSEAAAVALEPLVRALEREPDAGRVLFVEGLAGGQRIRRERGAVVGEFERRVQAFLARPANSAKRLDIPAMAVMGALRNIVSGLLRTYSEDRLSSLMADGLLWLASYAICAEAEPFSTGPAALLRRAPEPQVRVRARVPSRLPRGRHRLPAGVVVRSQRERIIYGTAEVMMAKGYEEATVTDIVAQAGISRDVFYEHFAGKPDAFAEAQQHPTQFVLDTCGAAYFSVTEWPERVWRFIKALLGLIAENPAISHLRLVECYGAGPSAIRRAEEITRSFTFFLEEGYGYRDEARGLPRLYLEAITGAMFEIIQRQVAAGEFDELPLRLPQLTYIAIAPFVGAAEAVAIVQALVAEEAARV